jgi:hypothetical protein
MDLERIAPWVPPLLLASEVGLDGCAWGEPRHLLVASIRRLEFLERDRPVREEEVWLRHLREGVGYGFAGRLPMLEFKGLSDEAWARIQWTVIAFGVGEVAWPPEFVPSHYVAYCIWYEEFARTAMAKSPDVASMLRKHAGSLAPHPQELWEERRELLGRAMARSREVREALRKLEDGESPW